uniref:Uncharacterized protein n=1 Tax=Cynoglossus semilaevis TaxID=244447 RepID=A0A3P8VAL9_CYNSE
MRAVAALLAVPELERNPVMTDFAAHIRSDADMASMFQSVQDAETGSFAPTDSMDMN